VLAGAVAAVIVVIVVVVLVLHGRGGDGTTSSTATGSSGPSPTPPAATLPASKRAIPTAPPPIKTPKPTAATFKDKVVLDNKVAIEVTRIESVKGVARGIGEVAGPALRFTVQVTNGSSKALNLDLAIVSVYSGAKDNPASALSGPGATPLPEKLKAGAKASGTYVFGVPVDQRGHVRVDFSYIINQPTVIFRGPGT
jgi:hypothetical protein